MLSTTVALQALVKEGSDLLRTDDLLKVKFVRGGRDVATGLDCYGLCKEVYKRLGIDLPEYDSPTSRETVDSVVQSQKGEFERLEQPLSYSFVLFSIRPPYESHIGIVLEDKKRFIHMLEGTGCSIERLDSMFWRKRIRGYFKWNSNKFS